MAQEAQVAPESDLSGRTPNVGSGLRVPRVLFVGNDMAVLSEYRRIVQTLGLLADFALSGAQALRMVQSGQPPDVIVCKAKLSDLTGVDLIGQLSEHGGSWRKRVILVTSASEAAPPELGLATLREPFSAQAIWESIQSAISHVPVFQDNGAPRVR